MAPPFVLDYLAAHEVAHLREMNHSRRFWRLVEALCPQTRQARAWLNAEGAKLHAIGGERTEDSGQRTDSEDAHQVRSWSLRP